MSRESNTLHLGFGILGSTIGLFLFLAPIVTFRRIVINKSTEEFSGMPYVVAVLNCLLGTWYGLPFITKDNYLVTTVNGCGLVIELTYVIIFLKYASKRDKPKIWGLLIANIAIFSIVALVSIIVLHHKETRQLVCGIAASSVTIMMYASPLSVMRTVVRTKSVKYMPFLLSLFVFLGSTSWVIYGFIAHDKFIYIPQGMGSLLGIGQLILYGVYRNNNNVAKAPDAYSSMEMGNVINGK